MMKKEDITTEYKSEYSDTIKKSIIAFANTDGGTITIGIDDNGEVVGLHNTDEAMLQISNAVRDSISPDVSPFIRYECNILKDKDIILITVQKGSAAPYYLKGKGIRPDGAFIRQGASSVPASETAILAMIRASAGESYEANRSLHQELTFTALEKYFADAKIPLSDAHYRTLHLTDAHDLYTNLALLLSDQCPQSIKLAVFQGTTKNVFKDRQEFTGSLLTQLHDCYTEINRFNKLGATFDGLLRTDHRDYPETAIREALLNCIVHKEYALSGSTLISIFDDRMEFTSLGGLVRGISKNDMLLGISLLRNPNLANVFYRLKLIEAYGTGIPKIMESYESSIPSEHPKIEITDNAFKITLYSRDAVYNGNNTPQEVTIVDRLPALTKKEQELVHLLEHNKDMSRQEIETALGLGQSMAIKYVKRLLDKGYIEKVGTGKGTRYTMSCSRIVAPD